MLLCSNCPDNPACRVCADQLGAGEAARKVCPPRPICLTHLQTGMRFKAELRAVSRLSLGIHAQEQWLQGRYEVELAADFRIIAAPAGLIRDCSYVVMDIEQVLRRDKILDRLLVEEFQSWHLANELQPDALLADHTGLDAHKEVIMQELKKLSIFRQLREVYLFIWENGVIRQLGEGREAVLQEEELLSLVQRALAVGEPIREQMLSITHDRIFDVHLLPQPDQTCGIAAIDITEALAAERERQRQKWELFRDVLSLVTRGKLMLVDQARLYELVRQSEKCLSQAIAAPEDIGRLRRSVREVLVPFASEESRLLHFVVAVSEAATNCLKHGGGGQAEMFLSSEDKLCRIVISDQGKGISLNELPKATLQHGYSTSNTLGAGFQVMLQYADMIWLHSSAAGTKVVLDCVLRPRA
jgi:anti-sigma regulatory factor (Ser/Thr protein kinase)